MGPALATAGMLVAGLAMPVVAQDAGEGTRVCHDDPVGDVALLDDDDLSDDPVVDEPRADIVEMCVTSGPSSSYSISFAAPDDPPADNTWQQATFASWDVLTNGDHVPDFVIRVAHDPDTGQMLATVTDVRGTVEVDTCQIVAEVTETGLAVTDVASRCLGGTERVRAESLVFQAGGDDDGWLYDYTSVEPGTHPAGNPRETARLFGATRTETSVAISEAQFSPGDAATVHLARDDVFADAAVGGVLTDGPILVVPSCGDTPPSVRTEIDRLQVTSVTALGGESAICEELLEDAADGRDTARLGGQDRFETAVQVARSTFTSAERVYLARSDEFIDAVTGGTLTDGPILLVPRCGAVPAVVRAALDEFDPSTVVALGGDVAVCDETLAAAAAGRATARFAGDDRYHTAILVAQHVFREPSGDSVYLARADLPVDALAGGVLTDGPILTVPPCADLQVPAFDALAREISRQAPEAIVALGGPAAICDDTLWQAAQF